MGKGTVDLLSRLARGPLDSALLTRAASELLEPGDHADLVRAFRKLLNQVPEDRALDLAIALAVSLEELAADPERGHRDTTELLMRAAHLRRGARPEEEADAIARNIASAWAAYPDPRAVEHADMLFGAPSIDDAPDALLIARAQVDGADVREVVLETLQERWQGKVRDEAFKRLSNLEGDDVEASPDTGADAAADAAAEPAPPVVDVSADDEADELIAAWLRELDDASVAARQLLRRKLFERLTELERGEQARRVLVYEDEAPGEAAPALDQARELGAADDWEAAAAVLGEAARATDDAAVQQSLLLEQARILEAELTDTDAAERVYRRLRVLDTRSLPALTFYRRWFRGQDEPRRQFALLAQLHASMDAEDLAAERVVVATEMAEVAEGPLESPEQAIEAWRRLLDDEPAHSQACETLRTLYTSTERWHALADHLDGWVRALPESDNERRVELLFELIALYQDQDRLPMEDMVIATYQRIVGISPTDVRALDDLATRYEDRKRYTELVEVLSRKVEVTEDPAELLALFNRIADLYVDHIRSEADAVGVLERMLELDPTNIAVIQRLRTIYQRRHDSEHLYRTYQRELELVEGGDRLDVLLELANLATDQLYRHDEAAGWWGRILEVDPSHERALAALQELHSQHEDWGSYVSLLEQRLESAKTRKKRVEILQELGEVAYTRLGDEERALKLFAEICEISPFNSKARGFLQRLYVTRRSWSDLEQLYAPRDDWKGYLALLRDFVRKTDNPGLIADIHVESSRVQASRLKDHQRARTSLVAALTAEPSRVDIAQRLVDEYGDKLAVAERTGALAVLARHGENSEAREAAWTELGRIHDGGKDLDARFEAWSQALLQGAEGGRTDALRSLEAATEATGGWEAYAETLGDALARLPEGSDEARIELHRALGDVLATRLDQHDGALAHYKWVLQYQPGDAAVLDAIERIHLSQGNLEHLEEVWRARADHATDPEIVRNALEELGQLYEDVLGDHGRASSTYLDLLELDPDNDEALESLRRVLSADEAWSELAAALEDLAPQLSDASARGGVRLELAQLYRDRLDDPMAAAEHLRDLLSLPQADRTAVVNGLEGLFDDERARDIAAQALDEVYRDSGEHEALARVLEVRLAATVTLDERLAFAEELASLYEEKLDHADDAFRIRAVQFRLDTDDRATWEHLDRLAGVAEEWEALAGLWREALTPQSDRVPQGRGARNALRIRLAELVRSRFEGDDEALALYEAVLADADDVGEYPGVLEALEELHETRGDHEALVRIRLAASAAVLTGAARRGKMLAACALLVGPLERAEDAVEHYETLAHEEPGDDEVAELLEAVYEQLERWEPLGAHLQRRAAAVPEPDRADPVRFHRAVIRREHLDERADGLDDLLDLVGSDTAGAQAREMLLTIASDTEEDAGQRDRVAAALDSWYREAGDDWGLAATLEVSAELVPAGQPRGERLLEAAQLLVPVDAATAEGTDEATARRAFELYSRALGEQPTSTDAAVALDGLVAQLDAWADYADVVEAAAAACDESGVRAALLRRAALAAADHLDDADRAIAAWEGLLGKGRAGGGSLRREALAALDTLYATAARPADRVEILGLEASLEDNASRRIELLREQAHQLHLLGRSDDAIDVLELVLRESRATRRRDLLELRDGAVEQLELLLAEAGRFEDLVALLVEAAGSNPDASAATQQLYRAAEITEAQLGSTERSAEIYEGVRELDPLDEIALDALDRIYQESNRWADKAGLVEARLELAARADDAEATTTLLFTLGQLREHRLGQPAEAVESYAAILADAPDFRPALAALDSLTGNEAVAASARQALIDALRVTEDQEALAGALGAALAAGDEHLDAATGHCELAALLADALDRPAEAVPHAEASYRLAAASDEAEARRDMLIRVAQATGDTDALDAAVRVAGEVALALSDGDATVARIEADVVAFADAGFSSEALATLWSAIIEVRPTHRRALEALESLAREHGDDARLADVLGLLEATAVDPEERQRMAIERGDLLTGIDGRAAEAVDCYESVLAQTPEHREAYGRLAGLLRHLRRFEDLRDTIDARLQVTDSDDEARGLRKELGRLSWRELDDATGAVEMFAHVLTEDPADEDSVAALEGMWGEGLEREPLFRVLEPHYEATSDWNRLVALYTSTLETEDHTELAVECLGKVARIQLDHLDAPEAAFKTLQALVERVEDPEAQLGELESLAERLDAWGDLAGFYESMVVDGRGSPTLIAHLATVLRDRLDDADGAIRYFQLAVERAPGDIDAQQALEELLTSHEQWSDLAAHHRRVAESSFANDKKIAAHLAAAQVFDEHLSDASEAATDLDAAWNLAPTDFALAERIEGLLAGTSHRPQLQAHYRRWIERSGEGEQTGIRLRLIQSLLTSPEDADVGLAELAGLLEPEGTREAALPVLESFLVDTSLSGDAWRDAVARGADLMEQTVGDARTDLQRARIEGARLRVMPEDEDRRTKQIEVAQLLDTGGDFEAAIAQYGEALRAHPGDKEIDAALEDLAGRHDAWLPLVALWQGIQARPEAQPVRDGYLHRIADIYADMLNDTEQATLWFERLLAQRPDSVPALRALTAYHHDQGAEQDEARVLEAWLAQGLPDARVSELRRRLAVLRMDIAGDVAGARTLLEAELPDAAHDTGLRARLEQLLASAERFETLVEVYDTALGGPDLEDATRIELLAKKAQFCETRLDRLDDARDACRTILELDDASVFALVSLDRIERKREDWLSLDDILQRRVGLASDEDRVGLNIERATNAIERLDDAVGAVELASKAAEDAGEGAGPDALVKLLESLLRPESSRPVAAKLLEGRYTAREDWAGLFNVLAMQQAGAADADTFEALTLRMATLASEQIGDDRVALRTLLAALSKHPGRPALREHIEAVAPDAEGWPEVAETVAQVVDREDDRAVVVTLGLWLGAIHRDHLEQAPAAIKAFERVMTSDAENSEAMDALDALYRETEQWQPLSRLLGNRLALSDVEGRVDVLADLARLAAAQGGPSAAIPRWRELLYQQPDHAVAREQLEAMLTEPTTAFAAAEVLEPLYRKESDWVRLSTLLEARIAATRDAGALAQLHEQLGELLGEHLADGDAAFEHLASALQTRPGDTGLLRKLDGLAEAGDRWSDLAASIQAALDGKGPDELASGRRAELLVRLSNIYEEKTEEPDKAVAALEHVLGVDSSHRGALEGLKRLHAASGDTARMVAVTARLASTTHDKSEKARLWTEVYEGHKELGDNEAMLEACRAALEATPDDNEAAERLADLLESTEAYEALAELLDEQAGRDLPPVEAAGWRTRLGLVRETYLDDVEGAIDEYTEAWELDPEREDTFVALRDHLANREQWDELFNLLNRRADYLGEGTAAAKAWVEVGVEAERHLQDELEAARAYERALEADGGHAPALEGLIRMAESHGRTEELAELLERKGRAATDPGERQTLMARAAGLYADELGQFDKAEELLNTVLEEDADHTSAQRSLAELRSAQGQHAEAAELLEGMVESLEGADQAAVLLTLGGLYHEHLSEPDRAIEVLQRAQKLAPEDEALADALSSLYATTGSWDALKSELVREFEAASDANIRCKRGLALANLHVEHLDDDEGFLTWIGRAEEARRDSPEVAEAVVSFYTARERWEDLAPKLEWLVNYLHGKKLVKELPKRAHDLARLMERLDDHTKALEYYKMAMQADGTYLDNIVDYGRLLIADGKWDRAMRVHQNLQLQQRKLPDDATRAAVLYHLALASHELEMPAKARKYLKQLLAKAPDHENGLALKERVG